MPPTIRLLFVDHKSYQQQSKVGAKHTAQALAMLKQNQTLVRMGSVEEHSALADPSPDLDLLFKPGKDSKKWFAIGKPHEFQKQPGKEGSDAYNTPWEVTVTPEL